MTTRDYNAHQGSRSRRGKRGASGFFWFVTGAVCGAFAVGLAWTLQGRPSATGTPAGQAQTPPPEQPSFVYHQLLPELEVMVPDDELSAPALPPPKPVAEQKTKEPTAESTATATARTTEQQPTPPPAPSTSGSYLLQVASFRQPADAERLKAKLALLGVQSRIQRVTVDGKAYHRVRTGPYAGKQEAGKVRSLLSSNGFQSIAIRMK